MEITREMVTRNVERFEAQREEALRTFHECTGGIKVLQSVLVTLDKPEPLTDPIEPEEPPPAVMPEGGDDG